MRVVVAPDSFSGTLTAAGAASAIRTGWLRAAAADQVDLVPMSDGGTGFLDVLSGHVGGDRVAVPAIGPWGDPVLAEVLVSRSSGTAYVESAQTCGAQPGQALRPWEASTSGLAAVLEAAATMGVQRVVVGVGGTVTTDAGRGCAEALDGWPTDIQLVVATDVPAALLGPTGAAHGYAPQKGADAAMVDRLEARLGAWAAASGGLTDAPGAGAGGGLGFGLALVGAELVPGATLVADVVGLSEAVDATDLVVTGEGRFDWSSLRGKVVAEVALRATRLARPCVVIAGSSSVGTREAAAAGIDEVHSVAGDVGSVEAALVDPAGSLAHLAGRVAGQWSRG